MVREQLVSGGKPMTLDKRDDPMPGSLRRHAAWIFLGLAYLLSWGSLLPIVIPYGIPARADPAGTARGLAFIAMALGPPIASLLLTAALDGLQGINELVARLLRWRLPARDYVIALGLVPATAVIVGAAAAALSPRLAPQLLTEVADPLGVLLLGLGGGLMAGWLEEIGWTGFALHRMLPRLGLLRTGLLLGGVHGLWHLLAGYWGEGAGLGPYYLPYFLFVWVLGLVALRVLIAWLYERTQSVLIGQLAHASYTGGLLILWPVSASPLELTLWGVAFAVTLSLVVAGLCRIGQASRARPAPACRRAAPPSPCRSAAATAG